MDVLASVKSATRTSRIYLAGAEMDRYGWWELVHISNTVGSQSLPTTPSHAQIPPSHPKVHPVIPSTPSAPLDSSHSPQHSARH